jgi:ribose transport system ATP-binding protein
VEHATLPKEVILSDEIVLEVKGLTYRSKISNVSFQLKKGEILGIAGMLGSGRTELLKSIFGAHSFDTGDIYVHGNLIPSPTPLKMKNVGVALIPEDRKIEGLIQIASIKKNLLVASLDRLSKAMFIDRVKETELVNKQVSELQIKISDLDHLVSSLSGGNQQKVVIGKWLNTRPTILLLDEPTRGIDVNAKQQIFQIIWEQSQKGVSCVMVSSELEELIEVCHRILVMKDGKIIGEYHPEQLTIEDLYTVSMGGELQ